MTYFKFLAEAAKAFTYPDGTNFIKFVRFTLTVGNKQFSLQKKFVYTIEAITERKYFINDLVVSEAEFIYYLNNI